MARRTLMQNYARWHIWLGWLVAVPLLLWTLSGLVMVVRPIEEVRGRTLQIAHDPAPVAERVGHCLPEGQRRILDRVMLVDVEIALHVHADVDQRMARQLFDHMVEKADSGRHAVGAGAVEIDADANTRLARVAGDGRRAGSGGVGHARPLSVAPFIRNHGI